MKQTGQYYTFAKVGSTRLYSVRSIIHRYYNNKSLCGFITIIPNDMKYLKETQKPFKFCKQCERYFNTYDDLKNRCLK